MPQASDELRADWRHGEEDGGHDAAVKHLRDAGYTLDGSWVWISPKPGHKPTERDMSAIDYLIDEWDYGGIAA